MSEEWKGLINIEEEGFEQGEIQHVPIEIIRPNPYQPRKHIEPDKISELAQSIKTYGLMQPVVLRKTAVGTELVAGQRRMMACRELGWSVIPAIVRNLSDSAVATMALIENLQRENLTFLEEAEGYERLLREFQLTQEVLAQRLGKSQSTIANKLRILKLPEPVKEKLLSQELTERHARALLKLQDEAKQLRVLQEICNLNYTVKQTEKRVAELMAHPESPAQKERKKVIIRDIRIFLNTIRQAVSILEAGGLGPKMKEEDCGDHLEITIRLPKQKPKQEKTAKNDQRCALTP
ncbi:MAG: nucleoid occlusion protein [Bacillota bacterium]|nr:nucleoid occlusion protein [Bacillota bacterium]MDW7684287.1 nucleoid occlusion protein [Bacillota bacterium]